MSPLFVARADDIIEQIIVQCWLFQARAGNYSNARACAERTLERLLSNGLPYKADPSGLLLDPYAANNMIKSRAGEPADEAWVDWQQTTRRNAVSLPAAAHLYRLSLHREWHSYAATPGRPVLLRLPLPLRQAQRGAAQVRLLEPAGIPFEARETPGRVELRLDSASVSGPIVAELAVQFMGSEVGDSMAPSASIGAPVESADRIWLREHEGLIAPSARVAALADELSKESSDARAFAYAAWEWLMANLRFGDVHRTALDPDDPLGGLLQSRLADCMLGSSLLVALCRARGIPARLLSGYLLHPANLGPHTWAEVRIAPGLWAPFDYGSWCYCAGDSSDPAWGRYFRGRVDARFLAEVAPREFTGWGSAPPPERWFRLERLRGDRIEHTLHALPDGSLFRRDLLDLQIIGPAGSTSVLDSHA
jgi:transglutaminase-like putative cysteine protease